MITFISLKSTICGKYQTVCSNVSGTLLGIIKCNTLVSCLIVVAFTLIGQQVRACSLKASGVNFAPYNVFSNAALHSSDNIEVNCASGVGYTIALSEGIGNYEHRAMISGAHALNYNLYTAVNYALVWGNTTSGTITVSESGTGVSVNHVVYGQIPPHQNVPAGSYSDTITVEITF